MSGQQPAPRHRADDVSSTTNSLTENTDHNDAGLSHGESTDSLKLQVSCLKKNKEILRLEHLFDHLPVQNALEREATKQRYINILKQTNKRASMYSNFYYSGMYVCNAM